MNPTDEIAALKAECARLRAECMRLESELPTGQIQTARSIIAQLYIEGAGIEVGAGATPFPLPEGAAAAYGDVRNLDELRQYFGAEHVALSATIDAQTFAGVPDRTQDFVIAAHVIEHLFDPIGAVVQGIRVLRPGGIYVLAVPDMRFTFDVDRPETALDHVLEDFKDGGAGTRLQAYREHFAFVHPRFQSPLTEEQIDEMIARLAPPWPDIHVHAWTGDGFAALLDAAQHHAPFRVDAWVANQNENIFVLRKKGRMFRRRRNPLSRSKLVASNA